MLQLREDHSNGCSKNYVMEVNNVYTKVYRNIFFVSVGRG